MKNINLIPFPAEMKRKEGAFLFEQGVCLSLPKGDSGTLKIAELLALELKVDGGVLPAIKEKPAGSRILLEKNKKFKGSSKESYRLVIGPDEILISASENEGIFRGTRSLRQLIKLTRSKQPNSAVSFHLPCLVIEDSPRFEWRGLNLDCARHFMSLECIKKYIDLLALYRMNVFHWHLIDDQGWRLEIKKYPRLTEIGAWRPGKNNSRYGGFYSQEQIKEVVAYAAERYITVVPEIEMPGHCRSALAAYPDLSCTGRQVDVEGKWGIFKDVYCGGSDETIAFLENILDEVVELFPSKYIHIGGDECLKARWKECPRCRNRIKEEGLVDEDELQSWFIGHFGRYLAQKKRKIVGWDEICEGGIPGDAVVQSWRGTEGAIEAVKKNHKSIVSPTSHTYFDYGLARTDLEKVYSFDPVPDGLLEEETKLVLGTEANMWTEYAPEEKVDAMLFPRLVALAEVAWSSRESRDWKNFKGRLKAHYPMLDVLGVRYGAENETSFHMIKYFLRDAVSFFKILKDDPATAWMHLLMYVGVKK